jgi:hypothetical protein
MTNTLGCLSCNDIIGSPHERWHPWFFLAVMMSLGPLSYDDLFGSYFLWQSPWVISLTAISFGHFSLDDVFRLSHVHWHPYEILRSSLGWWYPRFVVIFMTHDVTFGGSKLNHHLHDRTSQEHRNDCRKMTQITTVEWLSQWTTLCSRVLSRNIWIDT